MDENPKINISKFEISIARVEMVNAYDAFLRSLEKPVMLWLLSRKPRHGYELILEFKKLTGRKLKPSIVYPFLHKLEMEGFAASEWIEKGRRKIKCYSLTSKGENLLKRMREMFSAPLREIVTGLVEKRKR